MDIINAFLFVATSEKVMKIIEKLSSMVFNNSQILMKLAGNSTSVVEDKISPVKSIAELEVLEEKLKNPEEFSKMVSLLLLYIFQFLFIFVYIIDLSLSGL